MSKHFKIFALMLLVAVLMLVGLSYKEKSNEAKIAKIFYEDNHHKILTGVYGENLPKYFESEDVQEIIINLDNLVLYNSQEMIESLNNLDCKLSKSKLIITPKSPYGPKDYSSVIHCIKP